MSGVRSGVGRGLRKKWDNFIYPKTCNFPWSLTMSSSHFFCFSLLLLLPHRYLLPGMVSASGFQISILDLEYQKLGKVGSERTQNGPGLMQGMLAFKNILIIHFLLMCDHRSRLRWGRFKPQGSIQKQPLGNRRLTCSFSVFHGTQVLPGQERGSADHQENPPWYLLIYTT